MYDGKCLAGYVVQVAFKAKDEEQNAGKKQGNIRLLFLLYPIPKRFYKTVERPENERGKSPEYEESQNVNYPPIDSGRVGEHIVIGNLFIGIIYCIRVERFPYQREAVFLSNGLAGLPPVPAGMGQDGGPGNLPLYKHLIFNDIVVFPCILVRLFQTKPGFLVMGAVGHCHLT